MFLAGPERLQKHYTRVKLLLACFRSGGSELKAMCSEDSRRLLSWRWGCPIVAVGCAVSAFGKDCAVELELDRDGASGHLQAHHRFNEVSFAAA